MNDISITAERKYLCFIQEHWSDKDLNMSENIFFWMLTIVLIQISFCSLKYVALSIGVQEYTGYICMQKGNSIFLKEVTCLLNLSPTFGLIQTKHFHAK